MHSSPLDTSLKSPSQYKLGCCICSHQQTAISSSLLLWSLQPSNCCGWSSTFVHCFFWSDALSCRSISWHWISLEEICSHYKKKRITLQTSSKDDFSIVIAIAYQLIHMNTIWLTQLTSSCAMCCMFRLLWLLPCAKKTN